MRIHKQRMLFVCRVTSASSQPIRIYLFLRIGLAAVRSINIQQGIIRVAAAAEFHCEYSLKWWCHLPSRNSHENFKPIGQRLVLAQSGFCLH